MKKRSDYRLDYILHEGDQIHTDHAIYTISGEPLGFGGSSILYPARKDGSDLDCAIKEWFPKLPASFERRHGIIQPKDPNDTVTPQKNRERFEAELKMGEQIRNTTVRAIHLWGILKPTKMIINGKAEDSCDVANGLFAVMERMDQKGKSFNQLLRYISEKTADDHPLKTGGLPKIHTTALIMEQVLLALQSVHETGENGYIFGDIQDGNIYFANCRLEQGDIGTGMLLDFGCTKPLSLIEGRKVYSYKGENIFSSKGYIPPEIADPEAHDWQLTQKADIYSAGCLMLRCLLSRYKIKTLGDTPYYKDDLLDEVDASDIGCSESNRRLVNHILEKAMQLNPEDRSSVDEMLKGIQELKRDTEPPKYLLPTNLSSPDFFVPNSRDKELSVLTKAVKDGETVFLHGVGGIGKTECAIQLAKQLDPPRGAYLIHFQNSMKETVLKMNFSGYKFAPKKKGLSLESLEEAEYQERLEILREHYHNTVLIVDNFDADNKTLDELRREPAFKDFLGLDLNRIFTTRYPVGRKDWEIRELSEDALLKLMRYYCTDSSVTDEQCLAILKEIQNHTLTATLIAKTLEESWGEVVTPEMILEALRGSRLSQEEYPEVVSDQNRSYQQKQIYEHLKALFVVNHLDKDAKRVLSYASLFPNDGILVSFLMQLISKDETEKIKRLVKQGWLVAFDRDIDWVNEWMYRELEIPPDKRMLRIHPLIREVVCNEISEYERYSLNFLGKLKDYYYTVRDGEYRWAEEFSDDGEVTNPNYQYIAGCLILASKMLPKNESMLLHGAGEIYLDLADQRALACFQRAVALEEKSTSSKHFLAECYTSLGDAYADYRQSSNSSKALEYAKKAVELMETGEFSTSEVSKAYHKLAYRYHFVGDEENFVYWMEKCVSASLQCWEPSHPRITSGYACLAEAYRHLVSYYKERILRKRYLEHKIANGGLPFTHQEVEYQSMLSEAEYTDRITYAEKRLAECFIFRAC